ncbi:alpha/beta hydrolase [bacterium]|nr:alpha/beta hydrolase [bacterium]
MSNHAHKSKSSQKLADASRAHAIDDQVDHQALQRFLQHPTAHPSTRLIRAAQQHLGNQGLQRIMRQASVPARQTPIRPTIQRMMPVQKRIGHGAIQRNFIRDAARQATFGSDDARQRNGQRSQTLTDNQNIMARIETVSIPSGSNQEHTLRGWHYISADPTQGLYAGKTVLFLSGSANAAENYSKSSAEYYCGEGANVLAVNYRGFGSSSTKGSDDQHRVMSSSELTDTMLYEDARSMFNWLSGNSVTSDQVIVQGYSLGGAVAANLVASLAGENIRVGGLVLHSAIDSAKAVATRSWNPFSKIKGAIGSSQLGSDFNTLKALKKLSKIPGMQDLPIAVISGNKKSGDQLSDDTTGIHKQLGKMGFTNTGKKVSNMSHDPDHLKNPNAADVVKNLMGTQPNTTPQTTVAQQPQTTQPDTTQDGSQDVGQDDAQNATQDNLQEDFDAADQESVQEMAQNPETAPLNVKQLIAMWEQNSATQ